MQPKACNLFFKRVDVYYNMSYNMHVVYIIMLEIVDLKFYE